MITIDEVGQRVYENLLYLLGNFSISYVKSNIERMRGTM